MSLRHRDFRERGVLYLVETSAGNRYTPADGVAVVEIDELMYGGRLQGRHKFITPASAPFVVDEALTANLRHLRPIICPGAARPLQPRQRAGGGPIRPPCCNGNVPCMFNNGFRVYDRSDLCRFVGTHPSHIRHKNKFNNVLAVLAQRHMEAERMAWSVNIKGGVPFVSHTNAVNDMRLGAWWLGLLDHVGRPSAPPLPVVRVLFLFAPSSMPGQLLLDAATGLLPSVTVPQGGVFVDQVVAAFESTYTGAYLFDTRLVFLCDFLQASVPCAVFFTSSIAANDAYFLHRFGGGGATDPNDGRTYLNAVPISTDELDVSKREWHCLQAKALLKASALGFLDISTAVVSKLQSDVDASKFERSSAHFVDIDNVGLERVRSILSETSATPTAPTSLAASRIRTERTVDQWLPPTGLIMCEPSKQTMMTASAEPTDLTAMAAQLTTTTRDEYAAKRKELFGDVPPQRFGLGDKRDKLSGAASGPSRPGPVVVHAVGLLVQWKSYIVVSARSAVQRCFLHKASVGPPGRKGQRDQPDVEPPLLRSDLCSLLTSWIGGRALATDVNSHVERALRTEPAVVEWIIPSRDATGVLLSHSVAPTLVKLRVWTLTLPDEADWSVIAHQPVRALQVHVPLESGSTSSLAAVAPSEIQTSYSATPIDTPPTPYEVNTISLASPSRLHAEYDALHMAHFSALIEQKYGPSGGTAAHVSVATVDRDQGARDSVWPSIYLARQRRAAISPSAIDEYQEWSNWIRLLEAAAMLLTLRETVTLTCPGISRYPYIPVYCNGTVFSDIGSGLKTVESRLAWGPYSKVAVGWLLCIKRNSSSAALWAIVTDVHRHNSFHEAARFHGAALFPHLDLPSLTDAQIDYLCFCTHHPEASQRNMSTLRKWVSTMSNPGCVVCWTIRTVPRQLSLRTPTGFGGLTFHDSRQTRRRTGRAAWLRLVRGLHTVSITRQAKVYIVDIVLARSPTEQVEAAASSSHRAAVPSGTSLSLSNHDAANSHACIGDGDAEPQLHVALTSSSSEPASSQPSTLDLTPSQVLIEAEEDEQAITNSMATLRVEDPELHVAIVNSLAPPEHDHNWVSQSPPTPCRYCDSLDVVECVTDGADQEGCGATFCSDCYPGRLPPAYGPAVPGPIVIPTAEVHAQAYGEDVPRHNASQVILLREGTTAAHATEFCVFDRIHLTADGERALYTFIPGGKEDVADRTHPDPKKQTAVRETFEEVGVRLAPQDLHLSWTGQGD